MAANNPVKGTLFLYIATFIGFGLGYFYWFLVARITTPEIVGAASTAMTIVAIGLAIQDMGVAQGLPRFLGAAVGERNFRTFRTFLKSSLIVLFIASSVTALALLLLSGFLQITFEFTEILIIVIILTVFMANFGPPYQAALVSMLRTEYVALLNVLGGVIKICLGLVLISIGFGVLGIVLGSTALYFVLMVLGALLVGSVLRKEPVAEEASETPNVKTEVLKAGLPSYIPTAIQVIGTQIGILFVFGAAGAEQTGFYYMTLQIFAVAALVPNTIMTLLLPYVSGLIEQSRGIMSHGIKYAQVLSTVVTSILIIYPFLPLIILGESYLSASTTLQILLLSVPMIAIMGGVTSLAYAHGRYRLVLGIGLCTNLPRVILYFILTPLYGGIGAAFSFLIGTIFGIIAAVISARNLEFSIGWLNNARVILPAIVIGVALWVFQVPWFLGIPILLILLGIIYARSGTVSKDETLMIAGMLLPKRIVDTYGATLMKVLSLVYGD